MNEGAGAPGYYRGRPKCASAQLPLSFHLAEDIFHFMKSSSEPDFPLFRSEVQCRLLACLFLADPAEQQSLTELSKAVGASLTTTYREIERLETAAIVESEKVGHTRLVRANVESPIYDELRSIVEKTFGPVPILKSLLANLNGIDMAFIYGSFARRAHGDNGPPPRDIDVAIVGDAEVDEVFGACSQAESRLSIDVNPTILTSEEWESGKSGFVKNLRLGARIDLVPDDR